METELLKLKKLPSLPLTRTSRGNSDVDDDYLRYTSLKDIILNSSTTSNPKRINYDFDSSNITIRNRLVKRAASAYVQSATIMVRRNQNYFVNVWGRIRSRAEITTSCWNVYVRNPLHACFNPIYRFLSHTLGFLWNRITRIS